LAPSLLANGLGAIVSSLTYPHETLKNPNVQPGEKRMNNIFYIIGVIVVVLFILGYFGLR
jgi:hypothetical protein